VFELRGFTQAAARLDYLVANAQAFCRKPEDRFKVWPTNKDRAAFNEVMGKTPPIDYDELKHAESRLVQAHRYFTQQTEAWLDEASNHSIEQRADALENTVSKLLQLVVIDLQVDENAQEIFETLNARGTPLTPVDLIKNFVFQRLNEAGADVEKIYEQYWKQYENKFWEEEIMSGRLRRPRVVVFFNHWLFSMLGEDVTSTEVFATFKRFLLDRPELDTLELIQRIHRAALVYEDIIQKGAQSNGEVDRVALFAYRADAMQSDVVKPLILAMLDPDRAAPIPAAVIDRIIDDVESWLVRRMLVRVTSKNYNRTMAELVSIVRVASPEIVHNEVRSFLERQRGDSTYWPDDAMVRQSVVRMPIYKRMSRSRMRMVLEAVEDYLRGYGTGRQGLTGVRTPRGMYTIEHLMPQSWEANWAEPVDGDHGSRKERIHTLGNLTLVTQALNSKVSNGAWTDKERALNQHGVVLMNNRLIDYTRDTWSDDHIERRTADMIDTILAIWRVPEGHVIETMVDSEEITGASDISLADLIAAGILNVGDVLVPSPRDLQDKTATLLAGGRIQVDDRVFDYPSGAGSYLRDGKATNGYAFWLLHSANGPSLQLLRRKYYQLLQTGQNIEDIDLSDLVEESSSESVRDLQLRFWTGFAQHVRDCGAPFSPKAPRAQSWMSITIGSSAVHIDGVFTSNIGTMINSRPDESGPELRVDTYIYDDDAIFERLLAQRDSIDAEYGAPLRYYRAPGVASRRIFDFLKTDIFDESRWPEYFDWLTERIIRMREVMVKRL
jgi:hypothetical protein